MAVQTKAWGFFLSFCGTSERPSIIERSVKQGGIGGKIGRHPEPGRERVRCGRRRRGGGARALARRGVSDRRSVHSGRPGIVAIGGVHQRRTTKNLKSGGAVHSRELGGLDSHSIASRRQRLDEFNLEDVVDIDLAVKGHLRLVGAVRSCVFHSDGHETSGVIGARFLKNVQFLDLSKGQQERLEFQGL